MPAETEGSPVDGAAARERLEAERARLSGIIGDVMSAESLPGEDQTEAADELSSADQHPADSATDTQNREQDESIVDSVRAQLRDVDAALERVAGGTYGRCTACGRPIGSERLEALPATAYCIDDAHLAEVEASYGALTTASEDE